MLPPVVVTLLILGGGTAALWLLFWLVCRLKAQRCPRCGSRWQTELQGEWDGEMWHCHNCGLGWDYPPPRPLPPPAP